MRRPGPEEGCPGGFAGPSVAAGRGRDGAPREGEAVPGGEAGDVADVGSRGAPAPPNAALSGRQDLGDQQVGAGTHLGELVSLGLGHEVDRAQLQRLERDVGSFLGQGADHDHRRLVGGQKQRQGLQARDLGHLDVERDDIGFELDRLQDRFAAIPGCAHDLDLGGRSQQVAEQPPHQGRVIDHEDANAPGSGSPRALDSIRIISVRLRHAILSS